MNERTPPKELYLQWYGDQPVSDLMPPKLGVEISWCDDRVYPGDVKYVLASELEEMKQVASHNSDWFDQLVHDVAEKLGCEKKPTAILEAIDKLKMETQSGNSAGN